MIANLRLQLEKPNDYTFSDNEWETFFHQETANINHAIADKQKITGAYISLSTINIANMTKTDI